ncbi:MAG TPA: hypothetical protein VG889_02770 [Rhizomicrobium sp.]|nr:hypothetical protein [Rhizomicrobium sp.]
MRTLVSAMTAAAIVAGAVAPAMAAPICLQSYLIDHTSVKDANTILFHMKNGTVYSNTLKNSCPGLNFHGFVMNIGGGNGQVCDNQQSITVLESHETCMMGAFSPYEKPKT